MLLAALIAGPMIAAVLAAGAPWRPLRSTIVTAHALLLAFAGMCAAVLVARNGEVLWTPGGVWPAVAGILEFAVIILILAVAARIRAWLVAMLAAVHLCVAVAARIAGSHHDTPAAAGFVLDELSLILVLIVTVVGSIITVYATGYMRKHEKHAPSTAAGTGRFFLLLVGFLGAMNGLVLANSMAWLCVFWEMTTLCSFMLIGHEGTVEARTSALRALLINVVGGIALSASAFWAAQSAHTESLSGIMAARAVVPMALLCVAAFAKSAQMPFQSWLLGAMVAPTPVSALLHAATMVKAGPYVVLRLAPAFAGTRVMDVVSLAGAFTFAVAATLAVSQSNAKKVLAYSTISNLGLIFACAGVNTPLAYAAALMILCFHAASKGLLFLCVGTVEQAIGSRDIEDMGGIMFRLPMTTVLMIVGMITMLMPPFGMLLSKWMAIEATINAPLLLVLTTVGSAMTVFFWAKWIGRVQTVSHHPRYRIERLPATMTASMAALAAFVVAGGFAGVLVYRGVIEPLTRRALGSIPAADPSWRMMEHAGGLITWPVFALISATFVAWVVTVFKFNARNVRPPYLGGENLDSPHLSYMFRSLKDEPETAWSATFYFRNILREDLITKWGNLVATLIVLTLFGVIS